MKTYLTNHYNNLFSMSEEMRNELPHLNCCEMTLISANIKYNLDLDDNTLKMAKCFGGGMNIESTCGIITGSLMVLGLLFSEHDNYKEITKEYINKFKEAKSSLNCNELKALYKDDVRGCAYLVTDSSEILEEIIGKYK